MDLSTKFHADGTVTVWNVYIQMWLRTGCPSDRLLATLGHGEVDKIRAHISKEKINV